MTADEAKQALKSNAPGTWTISTTFADDRANFTVSVEYKKADIFAIIEIWNKKNPTDIIDVI